MDYAKILSTREVSFEAVDGKLKVLCPFHEDTNPSGIIYLDHGNFLCYGCNTNANFFKYLAKQTNSTEKEIINELQKSGEYIPNADVKEPTYSALAIERWHNSLLQDDELLGQLAAKGITQPLVRKYRLGKLRDRAVVIPIPNSTGHAATIRWYVPKPEKGENKFGEKLPGKGKSKNRIFPYDQLVYDKILVTEGELKAIVAAAHLNEHGIGAISGTRGVNNFEEDQVERLSDKEVYICMDADSAGVSGSDKLCARLDGRASEVYEIKLKNYLDTNKFPKGDINDIIMSTDIPLLEIVEKAEVWERPNKVPKYESNGQLIKTDLTKAVSANFARKRIKFNAIASAVEPTPYSIPRKVRVTCSRDKKYCSVCGVSMHCKPDDQTLEVEKESPNILKMVGRSDKEQTRAFQDEFEIPQQCKIATFEAETFYHVEHACLSSEIDITNRNSEREMQQAFCISEKGDEKIELNEHYEMEGRMYPNPANQQSTLLLSNFTLTQDALSNYMCSNIEALEIFQPEEWTSEGIKSKLTDLYTDMEANVTFIFKRRAMHLAMDLAYHSPLLMTFDKKDHKAWTEILIVGDSSQGKSEILLNLINFYGLGEKVDCNGASAAGLLGGVQKFGDRWFVTWGKIPNHDRRLVALEELKGASIEVISKLRDMRSSGYAEITKIEKRKTPARTRLIAISNPRSNRPLSSYNYGVDTVVELIGNLEDVRRFDLALIIDRGEVNVDELQAHRPMVDQKYTSEVCRELVLWCWTRERVFFENEKAVLESASNLCKLYSDTIPIVDRGSMRLKIARLSAALAGRTFSSEDGETLLVREAHVKYITEFLKKEYSKDESGYLEYSKAQFAAETLKSPEAIEQRIATGTKYPKEFIIQMLNEELIDSNFLMDTQSWDNQTAKDMVSFLFRHRAIRREGRNSYRKTTGFTKLLKELSIKDKIGDIPDHLEPEKQEGDKF